MKRILKMAAIALLVAVGGFIPSSSSAQVGVSVSYQTFYDELSPHGRWIDYPEYGYVWAPNVGSDFRPYGTRGHWVWSDDYEWMWVSDYSWGWAPFHYGRWLLDPYYGWVWVPGYEWSPAWVAWRHGGDYYGWAPLRPGFNININIGFGNYNPPYDYWCFTPRRYISSPRIYNHYIDRSRNVTIINNTTIINNNYGRRNNVFVNGPRRSDAERYTGRITPVRFRESNNPGRTRVRGNEVSVFRPRIQQDNDRRFTPRNVERYDRNAVRGNNAGDRSRNVFDRPGNNQAREREVARERSGNVFDRNRRDNDRDAEIRRQQAENRNERNVFERPQRRQNAPSRPQVEPRTRPQAEPRTRPQAEPRTRPQAEPRRSQEPASRPQRQSRPQQRNVFERRSPERNSPARTERPQSQPRQERQIQQRQVERGNGGQQREQRSSQGQGRRFERNR